MIVYELGVEWRPVQMEGLRPIYWVSDCGTLVWIAPNAPLGQRFGVKQPRVERRKGKCPYLKVDLKADSSTGKRQLTVRLHNLVAAAFGAPGDGPVVRHLNGNSFDTRASNLRYGSYSENLADRYNHTRADYDDAGEEYHPDFAIGF